MSDYERDETRAALQSFFWQARAAQGVLNAATADPGERAKAACVWVALYRLVHSPHDETAGERAERLGCLESLATVTNLSPLRFYLHQFALDIGHAILASHDPVKELARILNGPPRRGRSGRPFRERIKIAASVEKLRATGMTRAEAYESVASSLGKSENVTSDAVRIIYGKAMQGRASASLVRAVAAGVVEF